MFPRVEWLQLQLRHGGARSLPRASLGAAEPGRRVLAVELDRRREIGRGAAPVAARELRVSFGALLLGVGFRARLPSR